MNSINRMIRCAAILGLVALSGIIHAADTSSEPAIVPQLRMLPAEHFRSAKNAEILAATRAGKRIVAVGDHGVVLLSDDGGKSYRQASSVPVSSALTAVAFADDRTGWAVGHWGVILKTVDSGDSWTLQRGDMKVDQPLFSLYFKNAREGWAVGLWSLMLHTNDGGANWYPVGLTPTAGAKKADRNLYAIFADAKGALFVACEQGRVMRSIDGGISWSFVDTGYAGSFWTGIALEDGALLVGGLRGTIYRSSDGGGSWKASQTQFKSSVTGMVQLSDKSIVAIGLDGVTLESFDDGVIFSGKQRADHNALTAVVEAPAGLATLFSTNGPITQ